MVENESSPVSSPAEVAPASPMPTPSSPIPVAPSSPIPVAPASPGSVPLASAPLAPHLVLTSVLIENSTKTGEFNASPVPHFLTTFENSLLKFNFNSNSNSRMFASKKREGEVSEGLKSFFSSYFKTAFYLDFNLKPLIESCKIFKDIFCGEIEKVTFVQKKNCLDRRLINNKKSKENLFKIFATILNSEHSFELVAKSICFYIQNGELKFTKEVPDSGEWDVLIFHFDNEKKIYFALDRNDIIANAALPDGMEKTDSYGGREFCHFNPNDFNKEELKQLFDDCFVQPFPFNMDEFLETPEFKTRFLKMIEEMKKSEYSLRFSFMKEGSCADFCHKYHIVFNENAFAFYIENAPDLQNKFCITIIAKDIQNIKDRAKENEDIKASVSVRAKKGNENTFDHNFVKFYF